MAWFAGQRTALAALMVALPLAVAAQQDQQDTQVTLEELGEPKRPQEERELENPVYIDFEEAPLIDVIRAIGLQTGRNFDVDPNVAQQKVTVIAHHPVPADLSLEILESILAARQLQMVEAVDGNLIRVMPRNIQQGSDKLPMSVGERERLKGYDRYAIHIVKLEYASASEVGELLGNVGSAESVITAYPQSNLLILRDTVDGIRNMLSLLEVLDVPGTGTAVEIFTLEWTRAEMLARQIEDVLLGDGGAGEAGQAPRPAVVRRQPRAAQVPGQPTAEVIGAEEQVLRIVPDERLNALVVVASEGMMEQVRFLVEQLDSASDPDTNNIHYRELRNADAEDVATALGTIISTAPPRQAGEGGAATGEVQPFERNVVISHYEQTNALLILATPQDFKVIDDMITKLDVPRRQVSVEAVIMEVTINDAIELRVESALLGDDDVFALSNTVTIANILSGGITSLAGPGGSVGIIDGTIDIEGPEGSMISVPNVPLLLRALETVTDVDVLSRPNLLVVDNESASINVGQEIPIITSLSDVDDRTGFQSRSQVNRRDTGVTLTVKPQVQEGDYVSIEVEVEVSSPTESDVGIDPNQTGATIAQSVLQSEVVVGDGQTGIIGGLIREQLDKSVSQVPLLGDLPVVGFLFRGKRTSRSKQNLVVLLSPHIIKRGADLARVTDYRVNEFYDSNVDAVFEKGFIKRVSGKREQRKEGPVMEKSHTREYSRNFGRGRIGRN